MSIQSCRTTRDSVETAGVEMPRLSFLRKAGEKLAEDDNIFRQMLDVLPAAVYVTDATGQITYFNEAAAALWGRRPELGESKWCGSWKLYWPDGRPMPHDQCPMARTMREMSPILGEEAVAERPDGTRVSFLPFPALLRDAEGKVIGAVNMLVDITERKRAELAAQHLAAIVASSDDAIVAKDLNGIITSWNKGAERVFGYTAEEIIGKPVGVLIPADRQDEEPAIIRRIREGQRIDTYETVRRRKDGSLVDISLTVSPITGADGRIVGASKIARDIAERKRAVEQQTMLIKEMSHRVKNAFAVVNGVVAQSARSAATPSDMAREIGERLAALARAHDLTRPGLLKAGSETGPTTFHALIRAIFSPYLPHSEADQERLIIKGPDILLAETAITSFALFLHELATNAVKCGALSSERGCVRIDSSVADGKLQVTWMEQGGPRLSEAPRNEGFGSLLMRRIVSGQFEGQLAYDWRPEGVVVRVSASLERVAR